MAANQTTNYQLNQWEATDQVLRTDFNADNAKIDAALAGRLCGKRREFPRLLRSLSPKGGLFMHPVGADLWGVRYRTCIRRSGHGGLPAAARDGQRAGDYRFRVHSL